MPYQKEHAARIKDPGLFEPNSFRSKSLSSGIRIIIGKLEGESGTTTQAYRFSVDQFTAEEAKKWLKDHNISYISFEAAKNKSDMKQSLIIDGKNLIHYGKLGMRWGQRKSRPVSSDHASLSKIKKKKIKDMTDEELNAAVKRMRLIKQYKKIPMKGGKQINKMSNDELQTEIKRSTLKQAVLKKNLFVGITKIKDINKMDISAVDKMLNRMILEKSYKDLNNIDIKSDLKAIGKLVNTLIIAPSNQEMFNR